MSVIVRYQLRYTVMYHNYSPEGLRANIGNTPWPKLPKQMFTLSAINNSAECESIWMKFGALWAKCWRLALADFGRDPRSSDSLKGSRNFVFFSVMRITHGFADFSSDKFYDIWMQQRRSVRREKLSEQNFEKFTIISIKGRFFKKNAKIANKYRTSIQVYCILVR